MDRRFRDRGPRVISEPDGDWWMIDGTRGNSFQGGAQVGKRFERPEDLRPAARFSEVRPGAYQPAEFLRENEEDGVWGSVIYTYTQRARRAHWHRYQSDALPSDFFRR